MEKILDLLTCIEEFCNTTGTDSYNGLPYCYQKNISEKMIDLFGSVEVCTANLELAGIVFSEYEFLVLARPKDITIPKVEGSITEILSVMKDTFYKTSLRIAFNVIAFCDFLQQPDVKESQKIFNLLFNSAKIVYITDKLAFTKEFNFIFNDSHIQPFTSVDYRKLIFGCLGLLKMEIK